MKFPAKVPIFKEKPQFLAIIQENVNHKGNLLHNVKDFTELSIYEGYNIFKQLLDVLINPMWESQIFTSAIQGLRTGQL